MGPEAEHCLTICVPCCSAAAAGSRRCYPAGPPSCPRLSTSGGRCTQYVTGEHFIVGLLFKAGPCFMSADWQGRKAYCLHFLLYMQIWFCKFLLADWIMS